MQHGGLVTLILKFDLFSIVYCCLSQTNCTLQAMPSGAEILKATQLLVEETRQKFPAFAQALKNLQVEGQGLMSTIDCQLCSTTSQFLPA